MLPIWCSWSVMPAVAGRHSRYSAENDIIKRALTAAEIPARLEPSCLSRNDGKRPDGLTLAVESVETLGALGEEAATFFRDIGRRIAVATGEPRSTQFLFQRLSIAIQRGNAASVVGTAYILTDALTMIFLFVISKCIAMLLTCVIVVYVTQY